MLIKANILTVLSCPKMHEHEVLSVRWTWSDKNPIAVRVAPQTADGFRWEIPLDNLRELLETHGNMAPGVTYECGVATFRRRASKPHVLAMRFPIPHYEDLQIQPFVFLMCPVATITMFVQRLKNVECHVDVDALIANLLA